MSLAIPPITADKVKFEPLVHVHEFDWIGRKAAIGITFSHASEGWYTHADVFLDGQSYQEHFDDMKDEEDSWGETVYEVFGTVATFITDGRREIEFPEHFSQMVEERLIALSEYAK
ncbi:MAG: hypothetical protein V4757_06780 [Pseudomonadota bacterium]